MPDRDRFRRLPRGWRAAARAFARFARGDDAVLDHEAVARGIAGELRGGVRTLARTLELFDELHHQLPLSEQLAIDQLAAVTIGIPRDRNDSLLIEAAERSALTREYDPEALLQCLVRDVILHNAIDAQAGVAHELRREGVVVDRDALLRAAEPAIRPIVEQLLGRPTGKRFQVSSGARRPVDLDANLLELSSW